MPRWSEDPEHILGVIANYLRLDDPEAAPNALFQRRAAEADEMIEALAARARRRRALRAALVRFALRRARGLVGLRELPRFYIVVALSAVRQQLLAVGAELTARGRYARFDSVDRHRPRGLRHAGKWPGHHL